MKTMTTGSQIGMVGGALLATACCWVPLTLGAAGLAIGGLGFLDAARPVFLGLTFALMGWCFFEAFLRRTPEAEPCADACGGDRAGAETCGSRQRTARRIFVGHAVLVAVVLAIPTWPGLGGTALAGTPAEGADGMLTSETHGPERASAVLEITGMTCMGCVRGVEGKLRELEGVHEAAVSLRPPRAEVSFDLERITLDEIIAHLAAAGYGAREERPASGSGSPEGAETPSP